MYESITGLREAQNSREVFPGYAGRFISNGSTRTDNWKLSGNETYLCFFTVVRTRLAYTVLEFVHFSLVLVLRPD